MPLARTTAAVILAATLLAAGAAACGGHAAPAPSVVPSDVHLATTGPARPQVGELSASQDLPAGAGAPSGAGDRLEAARTVAHYCRLIDEGQFARAGALCSHRRLWSRRELGAFNAFRFRSARVFAIPDARTFVLLARVRIHAGRGCTLPQGLATLFFTLGRVGPAVGGWLITAVATSP